MKINFTETTRTANREITLFYIQSKIMIEIIWLHGSKSYDNVDKMQEAIIGKIKESITQSMESFEHEVREVGGEVIIHFPNDINKMKVYFANLPEELVERMRINLDSNALTFY